MKEIRRSTFSHSRILALSFSVDFTYDSARDDGLEIRVVFFCQRWRRVYRWARRARSCGRAATGSATATSCPPRSS